MVPVYWKATETDQALTEYLGEAPEIPASYLSTLKGCDISLRGKSNVDLIPVAKLRCPGLLDFGRSEELKAHLEKRIMRVQKRGFNKLGAYSFDEIRTFFRGIDFAYSPHGNFFSQTFGMGNIRISAINIQEARLVILNRSFRDKIEGREHVDAFLFHELLGALGIPDGDYSFYLR